MSALANLSSPAGNIMVVDDNPANLKLLEDMLLQHGYEVRSFPRGRMALAAAMEEPPDLILLDINMPEMNGYQVCEQLKASSSTANVPVIFLSALTETDDKVNAFRVGGVDYISKPFQFEEVRARVNTHLQLCYAQRSERDLLEQTLGGAIRTLWELVQVASPVLALRSIAIRDIVMYIAKRLGVRELWQYELAGTLCLLGCLALPEEVFEAGYCGHPQSAEDDRMFRAHPARAARLLANIPRLELVSEIIRSQLTPAEPPVTEKSRQGGQILHLALEFDRRVFLGVPPRIALSKLRIAAGFDRRLLDALEGYAPAAIQFELRRLPLRDLRAGMILEEDVRGEPQSVLILKRGTVLNEIWVERLQNFGQGRISQKLLDIRTPASTGGDKPVNHIVDIGRTA